MNDFTEAEEGTQAEASVEVTESESIQEDELWTVSASTNPYDENFYLRLNITDNKRQQTIRVVKR